MIVLRDPCDPKIGWHSHVPGGRSLTGAAARTSSRRWSWRASCVETSTADIARNGFIGWDNGKSQVRRVATALGRLELHEPRRLLSRAMRLTPAAHGFWDGEYPSVDCSTLAEPDRIAVEIARLEPLFLSRLVAVFRTLPYDGVE